MIPFSTSTNMILAILGLVLAYPVSWVLARQLMGAMPKGASNESVARVRREARFRLRFVIWAIAIIVADLIIAAVAVVYFKSAFSRDQSLAVFAINGFWISAGAFHGYKHKQLAVIESLRRSGDLKSCAHCGYDRSKSASVRCPECGGLDQQESAAADLDKQ